MRRIFLCLSFISLSVLASRAQTEQDRNEIETVCNYYLDGGTNGDSVMFSKAFSPTGQMQYMRNDTLQIVSLKDFMARMRNTGQKTNRKTKIESIEVYGNAAVARLSLEYEKFFLYDFMSLLKTNEGWKIVGKIFSRVNK
jgi:hypothetical protein